MPNKKTVLPPQEVAEVRISYTPPKTPITIDGSLPAYNFFKKVWDPELFNLQQSFYALFLNKHDGLLCWRRVGIGSCSSCSCCNIDFRLIATIACQSNARKVIIAQNGPYISLDIAKKEEDFTPKLELFLNQVGVDLVDHLKIDSKSNSYFSYTDDMNDVIKKSKY
jgi:DNA repair protein RadC